MLIIIIKEYAKNVYLHIAYIFCLFLKLLTGSWGLCEIPIEVAGRNV